MQKAAERRLLQGQRLSAAFFNGQRLSAAFFKDSG
jgi:hypothetical protein